ncbi:MAG: hypothetical protein ACRENE_09010 [Polyangiaceae bacterium]
MSRRPASATQITNQFRTREGTVYEITHDEIRLRIAMTFRENPDGLGHWNAECRVRASASRSSIAKPGITREDALRAVARAWMAKQYVDGFPEMDWEAVATAMRAARAI